LEPIAAAIDRDDISVMEQAVEDEFLILAPQPHAFLSAMRTGVPEVE